MAIIYGRAESEKELLSLYPKSVKKIEDIDKVKQDTINQLKEEDERVEILQNKIIREKSLVRKFDYTIKTIRFKIKKYSKTKEIEKFEKNESNTFQAGAHGELDVLNKLSQLSDEYHILCGLNIMLDHWVSYRGKKNLRSAQMDFVVVSTKGVFVIEVKNWSTEYFKNNTHLSPYEQTDREGEVLWIFLKSLLNNIHVTNVLLPIHANMEYNSDYKTVFVSNLDAINGFIENQQDTLSKNDVQKITSHLKHHVTK